MPRARYKLSNKGCRIEGWSGRCSNPLRGDAACMETRRYDVVVMVIEASLPVLPAHNALLQVKVKAFNLDCEPRQGTPVLLTSLGLCQCAASKPSAHQACCLSQNLPVALIDYQFSKGAPPPSATGILPDTLSSSATSPSLRRLHGKGVEGQAGWDGAVQLQWQPR